MILAKKHIIYISILCLILFLSYYSFAFTSSKRYIDQSSQSLLEEAIEVYINKEKNNTYFSYNNYEHDPKKIGQYKDITVQYADTVFTFKMKIVDHETHINRGVQTLLLDTDKLSVDTLNLIFDSICNTNNVYVNSSIGVTASFYKKVNLLSRDTTDMAINYRAALYKQGTYEDINYYAFMEVTPYTYWKLLPKTVLYVSIGMILAIFGAIKIHKHRNKTEVVKEEINNNNNLINIRSLTKQQQTIMSMFLNATDYCVKKDTLKETLWPNHKNSTTNMTTAIKRLKDVLEKSEYGYTINTYAIDESFYVLEKNKSHN